MSMTTTLDMEAYNNEDTYGEDDQLFEILSRLNSSYSSMI
jgi:hypothetical protein